MISVLILTHNEAVNISDCMDKVNFSDDIVVLDSFSTDQTQVLVNSSKARLIQRPFDNYAAQRNYGLSLDFKYDWILMVDADERITPGLKKEIENLIQIKDNPVTLYRVRRKDFFMNKWIKHSSGYPTWFGRLFKKGCVRVEREINEEYYTEGKVGFLKEHMDHYPFNKGLNYWFERHNKYSEMEAIKLKEENLKALKMSNFFHNDPMVRRKVFKSFAYRLPLRPLLTFIFLYVFKLGILDGLPGFHYSVMRSFYEYQIELKMKEIAFIEKT